MNITKFIKATIDYFKYYSENPGDYTQQKDFIELVQNNNSVLEMLVQELWQPNKTVAIGQVVWSPNMDANKVAIVTAGGITDSKEPIWGTESTKETNVTYVMRSRVKMSEVRLDAFRPIGSIYISFNSVNPSVLFGGEWEKLEDGRIWLSAGTGYPAGSVGGEATHTLTTAELPSHSHSGTIGGGSHTHTANSTNSTGSHSHKLPCASSGSGGVDVRTKVIGTTTAYVTNAGAHTHAITIGTSASHEHTFSGGVIGSGQAHNNMQPWLAVYAWKRIA